MKMHPVLLLLLVFGFCGHYASEANVSQQKLGRYEDKRDTNDIINVGMIIDRRSHIGKVVESCIAMAITDFYIEHSEYKTRINLHVRDSMGDSLNSTAAALDLLENVEVHALIIPTISNEPSLIASLVDNANVPLLSFSAVSSLDEHPYYLQVGGDETAEFHGIAALIESFKWKSCAILHEDTAGYIQAQPNLYKILLKKNLGVMYQTPISLSATNDQIVDELQVIMNMKTSIIVVHLSPSLASKVFLNAKKLGMMSKGFAWIVTSKTMNLLSSHDSSVHELMQGALGFRSYIFPSSKLQNFTLRWRSESKLETEDLNVYGVWAYDAVWALAQATERAGIKPYQNRVQCKLFDSACRRVSDSGRALLTQIESSKFIGLAGVLNIKSRELTQTYEIVNAIGYGERRVGFWNSADGLSKDKYSSKYSIATRTFETIIWPGVSLITPASQSVQISGKSLRVGIPAELTSPKLINWRYDLKKNVVKADGFSIEVFHAAFEWLQYNTSFEFIPFSDTYNDLIYQVYLQKFDVAVGDISILANRSEYVDFTSPFTDMGVGVVTKLDGKDPWFFTKPLDQGLWIMCIIWFVAMGTIVWIIERRINDEFQGSATKQLGTLLWFAASTLVFAHRERLQSNISKFVVGIWLFVVLILTSSYTANLSSLLTVQRFKLAKSDYIGSANPTIRGHVISNLNFDDYKLKPYQIVDDYADALRRGSKNGGVGAIVDELPYIKIFLGEYPKEYTISQISMTTSGFGFAFPKGSAFAPELSRAIEGLREEGKLLEMEEKWFARESPMLSDKSEEPLVNALSIHDFSHLFLVSGISELFALILLLLIHLRERLVQAYLRVRAFAVHRLLRILRTFYPNPRMGIFMVPVNRNLVNLELVPI